MSVFLQAIWKSDPLAQLGRYVVKPLPTRNWEMGFFFPVLSALGPDVDMQVGISVPVKISFDCYHLVGLANGGSSGCWNQVT